MFNIRRDKPWFQFGDAPLEDLPGFRMNADGTVREASPGDLSATFLGIDPGDRAALPGGTMFNIQPAQNLPSLHNFRPPEERVPGFRMNADGSIRNASTPPARLHPDAGGNLFGPFDQPGTNPFTSVGDGSLPPYFAYSPGFSNGLGKVPTLDEGDPAGTAVSPPSNSPFFPGGGPGGPPFVAPPSPFPPGGPNPNDVLRPSTTSFSYMANPSAMSGLSFAGSNPREGIMMADGHFADAAAPDERLTPGQAADPNIVRARVGDGEQVAQATPPGSSAGSRGGSAANPGPPPTPGRNYGVVPQIAIERGMTELQKKINRDQAFRELTRQPLTAEEARNALPDDWESTKPADLVDEIKRAAERHGVPIQLLARLLYQEGKFNEADKLRRPLVMDPKGNKNQPVGYAQMTVNTLEELKRQATLRGDTRRRQELETYSLANREQSFDAAAEQLAYLYRHMGGSWPKAVASYNVGQDLKRWFDGANMDPQFFGGRRDKNNKPIASDKWTKEVPAYLRFILRGSAEDPATGDMYGYQPPLQYRVRDQINRPPARDP